MENIKAFIFDMDGVITETSENHYLAWKELAKSIGIEIDRSLNEQLKGISRMDSLEVILKAGHKENEFSEATKIDLATEKNNNYVAMISEFTPANLLEGIEDFFKSLKEQEILIGVASASRSAQMLIELMEIDRYIDYIVDPSTVPSKPAPDIFIKAAEGLGFDPKECVGVEDAIAGVDAIKAAGMYAVGIGEENQLNHADLLYKQPKDMNLEEIKRCFYEKYQQK
jgi:beta-phosphoglucomutase